MSRFKDWLNIISGADEKIRELERRNADLDFELQEARAGLQETEKNHGQFCEMCANGYKKGSTYIGGIVVIEGYGCKLEIPCENFKEKEVPKEDKQ